ncbi:MAG: alpha-ketoacid dehydrogenase subunit beta [Candidatus Binatia bacterium]|nr:alpha-ketoacid dehydrogenase subunit beta [Candidatus Binatia bacterium]
MAERVLSFSQALNEAMRQEMRRDPTVILMGEDVAGGANVEHLHGDEAWGGVLGVTKGLVKEFGRDRVLDTPISESAFIGAAVGAAVTGLRPIVEMMFVGFLGVCFDQILNQGAKLRYMFGGKAKVPVVIRTIYGAGFRAAAQHSQVLYSLFTHIPGLKTVVPSTPYDAKGLLISSIRDDDPVVFFEDITLGGTKGPVPEEPYILPLGRADVKRAGSDVTIVAIGKMVHRALHAAEALQAQGKSAEVIDPRTLSPFDEETVLASVKKTGRLVIVDESHPRCSMATDIAALVADKGFDFLNGPIKMVTAPHTPVPFSPTLEDHYLPNPQRIIDAALSLF